MNLLIDIGNTLCKAAFFGNDEWTETIPAPYSIEFIKNLLKKPDINKIAYASVRNHSQQELDFFASSKMIRISNFTKFPITNKYSDKNTLGDDRLSAVCGAFSLQKSNGAMLVIQAGTAFTFDYVNGSNEYLGGAISPGPDLRFKALHNFTDKLPLIEKTKNFDAIGTTTKDSISGGVMMGSLAEIQFRIDLFKKENPKGSIFLSGGNASYFVNSLKSDIFATENLVLHGLNYLLNLNS
jgi:type III pantothenate kinase